MFLQSALIRKNEVHLRVILDGSVLGGYMNQMEMLKIVEQFSRNAGVVEGPVKVARVADSITMYLETERSASSLFFEA